MRRRDLASDFDAALREIDRSERPRNRRHARSRAPLYPERAHHDGWLIAAAVLGLLGLFAILLSM